MAGAVDLFSGSNSISGSNLFYVDKNPLDQLVGQLGKMGERDTLLESLEKFVQTVIDQTVEFLETLTGLNIDQGPIAFLASVMQVFENLTGLNIDEGPEAFITSLVQVFENLTGLNINEGPEAFVTSLVQVFENLTSLNINEGPEAFVTSVVQLLEALTGLNWDEGPAAFLTSIVQVFENLTGLNINEGPAAFVTSLVEVFENLTSLNINEGPDAFVASVADLLTDLTTLVFGEGPIAFVASLVGIFEDLTGLNINEGPTAFIASVVQILENLTGLNFDEGPAAFVDSIVSIFENLTSLNINEGPAAFIQSVMLILEDLTGLVWTMGAPAFVASVVQVFEDLTNLNINEGPIAFLASVNQILEDLTGLNFDEGPAAFVDSLVAVFENLTGLNINEGPAAFLESVVQIFEGLTGLNINEGPQAFVTSLVQVFENLTNLNINEGPGPFLTSLFNALVVAPLANLGQFLQALEATGLSLAEKVAQAVITAIRGVPFVGNGIADFLSGLVNGLVNFVRGGAQTGTNLLSDPGGQTAAFWIAQTEVSRVTGPGSVSRSGGASLLMTSGGADPRSFYWNVNDLGVIVPVITQPDDWFYAECYVWAPTANIGAGTVTLVAEFRDSTDGSRSNTATVNVPLTKGQWMKVAGTFKVPATYNRISFGLLLGTNMTTLADKFFVDDLLVKEVTGQQNTLTGIHQAIVGASGSSLVTLSDVGTALGGVVDLARGTSASGSNLLADPKVSYPNMWKATGLAASTVAGTYKSAARSLAITSAGATERSFDWTVDDTGTVKPIITQAGDVFYCECYVLSPPGNAAATVTLHGKAVNLATGDSIAIGPPLIASPVASGPWVKLSGRYTIPDGYDGFKAGISLKANQTTNGNKFYIDDMVVQEVTQVAAINTALYDQATPGVTIAQAKVTSLPADLSLIRTDVVSAATAGTTSKALASAALAVGVNAIGNPNFDSTSFYMSPGYSYSTEQKRSGVRSLKGIANGTNYVTCFTTVNDTGVIDILCSPGDTFYVEVWVFGKSTNVQTSGGAFSIFSAFQVKNSAGTVFAYPSVSMTASTALNGVWTKLSGFITIPANGVAFNAYVSLAPTVSNNETYYFDDMTVLRYTDTQNVIDSTVQGAAGGTTTGYTLANLKTNVSAVNAQANLGVTNAATAQSAAATADTKAVNASNATILAAKDPTNLVAGSDFDGTIQPWAFTAGQGVSFATDQYRSGTKSLKFTGSATANAYCQYNDAFGMKVYEAKPGEQFYVELWARKTTDFVGGDGGGPRLRVVRGNGPLSGQTIDSIYLRASDIPTANTWTKLTKTVTVPDDGTSTISFAINGPPASVAGSVWIDDIAVRRVVTAEAVAELPQSKVGGLVTGLSVIDGKAVAAQTAATTADGKAVVADGKAVAAQGTANTASTTANAALPKTTFDAASSGGSNLATNPSFEDTAQYLWANSEYSTDYARTGYRSAKLTAVAGADRYVSPINVTGDLAYVSVAPGQVFYVEFWMYQTGGTVTSAGDGSTSVLVQFFNGAKVFANVSLSACLLGSATAHNGVWTKVSGTFTTPAGAYNTMRLLIRMANITAAGTVRYYDDVVVRDVTEAYIANLDADAAQATANTGVTNAATADGKAVTATANAATAQTQANLGVTNAATADGKAVTADGKAVTATTNAATADAKAVVAQSALATAIASGANLSANGGFENTSYVLNQPASITYSTEFKRSGTRSAKLVGATGQNIDCHFFTTTSVGEFTLPVNAGDVLYFEAFVRGGTGNTKAASAAGIRPFLYSGDPAAPTVSYPANIANYTGDLATLNAGWNKVSGTYTVPAGGVGIKVMVECHTGAGTGAIIHVDDMACYRVTEGYVADGKAVAAQATANTGVTNAGIADGKAVTATTNAATAQTQANLGVTNAATAATAAATADGKAVTAQTSAATADGKAVTAQAAAVTADGKAADANLMVSNIVQAGSGNIATNAGFEDTTQYLNEATYVTSPVRTGYRAAKLVSNNGTYRFLSFPTNKTADVRITSGPNRVYYIECWVYGDAANTYTGAYALRFFVLGYGAAGYITAGFTDFAGTQIGTGTWVKLTATITMPNNAAITKALGAIVTYAAPATNSYYFDDLIFRDVTEAQTADTKAVAAQATANTGVTNAATADGKAVTADGKAVTAQNAAATADGKAVTAQNAAATADGKAVTAQSAATTADGKAVVAKSIANTSLQAGQNLITDPSCLNTNLYLSSRYSSDVAYTGTQSIKLTGAMTQHLVVDDTNVVDIPCVPGDVFYCESWTRGAATNSVTAGAIYLQAFGQNATKTSGFWLNPTPLNASPALNGVWTKMSGNLTIPAGCYFIRIATYTYGVGAAEVYYVGGCKFYRVTEANVADGKAVGAQATANTGVTNAGIADGKAITAQSAATTADGKAVAAQGTANTALTNAAAADAKAVTAQLMLDQKIIGGSSITTNPSFQDTTQYLGNTNFTYSTDQSFVGTLSAKFLSTAQYVALYGTTSTTTTFGVAAAPGQVYYFEVMVRSHASNALTSSSANIVLIAYFDGASAIIVNEKGPTQITSTGWYKLAGYVTVPAGAVTIRPRVDIRQHIPAGDIYYFDSFRAVDVTDAYAAKLAADAAQATANTAVTNAATADGKAVTADGKAVTAQAAAVTADGKAVVADGKAVTADGKAVTADGKAVAAQATANTATTNAATADGTAVTAKTLATTAIGSGPNLCNNGDFENNTLYANSYSSTDIAYSGTRSLKLIALGGTELNVFAPVVDDTTYRKLPCSPGDTFAVGYYVYGKATNVQSAGVTEGIGLVLQVFNTAGTAFSYPRVRITSSTALNGVWTKCSGYLTIPAGGASFAVYLSIAAAVTAGETYYFDAVSIKDWSGTQNVIDNTVQAVAGGSTTGYSLANLKTNVGVVNSQANLGVTNAATADGKAVIADGKAVTADGKAVTAQTFVDAVAKSSDNRVISPDFEDATIARYGFEGGSGNTLTYDTAEKFSGLRSLKVTVTNAGWNGPYFGPGQATKWQHTVKPGDVMYASVMFKPAATNNSAVGYVGLWMRYSGDGTTVDAGSVSKTNSSMTGGWERLETWSTVPAGKTTLEFFFLCDGANLAGTAYWLDDVVLRNVTEARAAQTTADTAVTNAATADGKAVIADGKAVVADGKAVVAQGLSTTAMASGSNLLTNFGFENTSFLNAAELSTEQAYKGSRSFKITATVGTITYNAPFQCTATGYAPVQALSGDSFYFEMMVFPHTSNVTGSTLTTYMRCDTTAGAQVATPGFSVTTSTLTKGQWNKVSGYMNVGNVPTSATGMVYLSTPSAEGGNRYYIDDAALYRISESQNIIDNVVQGIAGGTSTGNTVATLKTNAFNVQATAADGVSKANAADTKAVTAQTVASTALKTGWNLVPNNSFEDSTIYMLGSGSSYSTDQARSGTRSLRLTGSGQPYAYLFGTTTASYYLPCKPGDVFRYSYWVYGSNSNTATETLRFGINCRNNTGAGISAGLNDTSAPTSFNNVWTQVTGTITLTTDTTISQFDPYIQRFSANGGTFHFDDFVLERITESNTAKVAADAADTKAVAAKEMIKSQVAAGSNMLPNGGFESTSYALGGAGTRSYSTEQKRQGSYSLKISANGTSPHYVHFLADPDNAGVELLSACSPGDSYYMEIWVRGSNVTNAVNGQLRLGMSVYSELGAYQTNTELYLGTTTALNNVWTKFSGYVTVPANGFFVSPFVMVMNTNPSGEVFYFDDAVVYRFTDTQNVIDNVVQGIAGGTTTGNTLATLKTNAFNVQATAADGVTKANTADGKAVVAQNALNTAISGGANLCANGGFENTSYVLNQPASNTYSTEFKRSGLRSAKMVGITGQNIDLHFFTSTVNPGLILPVQEGDVLYFETWIRGGTGNTKNAGINLRPYLYSGDPAAPTISYPANLMTYAGTLVDLNAGWQKISGTFTVPAGGVGLQVMVQIHTSSGTGCIIHVDDMVCYRITEAKAAEAKALTAQSSIDLRAKDFQNLVAGLDFELGAASPWVFTAGQGYTIATDQKRGGTSSMKVTGSAVVAGAVASYDSFRTFEVKAGEQFFIELWARRTTDYVNNSTDGPRFRMARGAGGSTIVDIPLRLANIPTADTWTRLTATGTVPADGTTSVSFGMISAPSTVAGSVWMDDVVVRRVVVADAVAELPNTKVAGLPGDLSTLTTAAGTAQTAADKAKSFAHSALQSGSNLATNPGFENSNLYINPTANRLYSTEQKRSGTQSLKMTSYIFLDLFSNETETLYLPAVPGDRYYVEVWVYGASTNVDTTQGVWLQVDNYDAFGVRTVFLNQVTGFTVAGNALKSVWTKLSGFFTIPANTVRFTVSAVQLGGSPPANSYYWDDFVCYRVTESQNIIDNVVQGIAGGTTTGNTLATLKTNAFNVQATAGDGVTKANTADTKAVVAQGLASSIITSGSNICANPSFENINFAVAAGTANTAGVGASYSTAVARTGTRSAQIVSNASSAYVYITTDTAGFINIPAVAADVFYVEFYVSGKTAAPANSQTTGGLNGIRAVVEFFTAANASAGNVVLGNLTASTALNGPNWTKVSGYATAPANTASFRAYIQLTSTVTSGQTYYFDDVVIQRVTEGYLAENKAQGVIDNVVQAVVGGTTTGNTLASLKSNVNTVKTTADSGVTKGDNAQASVETFVAGGNNILNNPSFENLTLYRNWTSDTTQARSGLRSAKITGTGALQYPSLSTTLVGNLGIQCRPGQTYYAEMYVMGDTANTMTLDATEVVSMGLWCYNKAGTFINAVRVFGRANAIGKSNWVKVSGFLTIPSATANDLTITYFQPLLYVTAFTSANSFYVDDVILYETTDSQAVIDLAIQGIVGGTTTGYTADNLKTNLYTLQGVAAQGVTDASTADGKAVVAQTSLALKSRDFSNLAAGSDFEGITYPWVLSTGLALDTAEKNSGTQSLKLSAGTGTRVAHLGTYPTVFEAKPGEQFYVEFYARRSASYVATIGSLRVGDQGDNLVGEISLRTGSDALEGYVSALLQFNGLDGATAIYDSSISPYDWTAYGDAKLATAQAKFGDSSLALDGTGDYIKATAPSTDFSFGTDNFTVEMWVRLTANTVASLLYDARPGAQGVYPTLYFTDGGALRYYVNGADRITGATAMSLNTWHHVAVARVSGVTRMFLNGVQQGSSYTDANNYLGSQPIVGAGGATATVTSFVNGYFDDLRVTKLVGRYSANFTAPTAQFPAGEQNFAAVAAWSKFSDTFTVPAGDTGLNFSFQFGSTQGDLWLDDVVIRKIVQQDAIGNIPQSKIDGLPNDVTVSDTLATHSQKIQELESTLLASESQGKSMAVNFATYPNGALTDFTVEYPSGTGTSTIGVVAGVARWTYGTVADRTARIVYTGNANENGKTLTNFQSLRGTLGSIPGAGSSTTNGPRFWAIARVSDDRTSYVWARAVVMGSSILNLKAEMGCTINGVETIWRTNIPLTWSLNMTFLAGANGNERAYQVYSGTTLVAAYEEGFVNLAAFPSPGTTGRLYVANDTGLRYTWNGSAYVSSASSASLLGNSTATSDYRRWGAITEVKAISGTLRDGGSVASAAVTDNAVSPYKGSVARMIRTSSATATFASGENVLPPVTSGSAGFFTTEYETLDVDSDDINGTFTVKKSKMYMVTARIRLSASFASNCSVNLQKWNGTTWVTVQNGISVWPFDAFHNTQGVNHALSGTWLQYLNVDEKVRLVTWRENGSSSVLRGSPASGTAVAGGAETYFGIAGLT